jgi:hypothetical protein
VVKAVDAAGNESEASAEVGATPLAPPPQEVVAEIRFEPAAIPSECLFDDNCGDDRHRDHRRHDDDDDDRDDHRRDADDRDDRRRDDDRRDDDDRDDDRHGDRNDKDRDNDDRHDGDRDHRRNDDGDRKHGRSANTAHSGDDEADCPRWLLATVELPNGIDPASVDPRSVRLLGSVRPDSGYLRIVDRDRDGRSEAELRFELETLRGHLDVGPNQAVVTGRAGAVQFRGSAVITVLSPEVDLEVTPTTLSRRGSGDVKARLSFGDGLKAHDVDVASLRLNGSVKVKRVVEDEGRTLQLTFDRRAVLATVPNGTSVEIRVTGKVRGLSFEAKDRIKVID